MTASSYKSHIKATLSLAYPVMIGQLGHVMMGVIDSLFVGRLGPAPLAAVSIASGIFFLIFVIGLGITFAISPIVAIAVGSGKKEQYSSILANGLFVNIIAGLVLISILFTGSYFINYLNQPPEVAAMAAVYLRIISFSILPLMLFQTYRQFIEGFSIMKPAMFIAIGANVINAVGNWLLIFGNLGFPEMGFQGSAFATLITRIGMAAAMIWYMRSSERFRDFSLRFTFHSLDRQLIRKILSVGISSGFQYFFEVGAFSAAAIEIGWIGTTQLAAHQIALNLASVSYMAASGISAAGAIRVGTAFGKMNIVEIRRAGFSAILLSAGGMMLSGIFFVLFRGVLPYLYISDQSVVAIASTLILYAAFFQMSDGTQVAGLGVLRGLTDVKMPTLTTFISYWILGLPSGYILAFKFGMGAEGIWIGFIVGLTASAIMLTTRFHLRSSLNID
ncbi:MAG: MATE family efflux transporter [Syntrophothermus sp.]